MTIPVFLECGCCGGFHPEDFNGDCRDAANRYTWDELDCLYGAFQWRDCVPDDGSDDWKRQPTDPRG